MEFKDTQVLIKKNNNSEVRPGQSPEFTIKHTITWNFFIHSRFDQLFLSLAWMKLIIYSHLYFWRTHQTT